MYKEKISNGRRLLAGLVAALLLTGSGLGYVQAENTGFQNEQSQEMTAQNQDIIAQNRETNSDESENIQEGQNDQELEEQDAKIQDVNENLSENREEELGTDAEIPSEIPEEVEDVTENPVLERQKEVEEDFLDRDSEIQESIEEELTDPDQQNEVTAVTEGKAITSSGSEYKLVTAGSEVYKGNYNLLGDSNNRKKFVFVPFNNAGNNVTYLEVGGVIYFVPKNLDAAGKYGFLVQNVGFNSEMNCGLDMRFTVTGYKDYVLDDNGKSVSGIYPAFGFWKKYGLCFAFGGADQNIRIEILKHGTNTPVKGNYSFRWLDIDAGQRFGIRLLDGSLAGRYAMKSCSAYYQNDFSRFNQTYQMVNAAQDTDYHGKTGNWMDGTVYWELKDCSKMNLLIATAGNSKQGRRPAESSREKYMQYSTGKFPEDTGVDMGLLAWDGESYGARENPQAIYKFVSNTEVDAFQLAGKTVNLVGAAGNLFYYYLTNHVPVEAPAYYYNQYTIADTLPVGAVYDGAVQVIKGETGEDVTGWFQILTENQNIAFQSVHLSNSDFYGSTYIFKIRVRMDTSQLQPVAEGNYLVYRISNSASVTSCHKTDAQAKTAVSQPVYTTLKELGKGKLRIRKTDAAGKELPGAVFEIRAAENIYSPAGTLLLEEGTVVQQLTLASGKEISDPLYVGKYTVSEKNPPSGYCVDPTPQIVEVKGPGYENQPVEAVFVNAPTTVYLKKVSQRLEGESDYIPLQGVGFLVWNKESGKQTGQKFFTDSQGLILLSGYVPGTYCYQETKIPEGHAGDLVSGEFVIDENGLCQGEKGHVIQIENACIKAEFLKVDKSTGEPVPGAKLQLTDGKGKVIATWISSEQPYRINRIPKGIYTLTELEAPEGYKKGDPVICQIEAKEQIQSFQLTNVKYVTVILKKTIHGEEIVQAHGIPCFFLGITGEDLDGESYTLYKEARFPEAESQEKKEYSVTVTFKVPAGKYTAFEEKTARYTLEETRNVKNGTITADGCVDFGLSGNQDGEAEFVNKKVTDEYLSHTDFVRNVVIPER